MRILLTGGAGDLGKVLSAELINRGDMPVIFDIRKPTLEASEYLQGSILDRDKLLAVMSTVDCVVHIAAWHGYHEFTKKKNVYDFWDLNVTGTFNVFQTAVEAKLRNIIFISSEAVSDTNGNYGWTKVLGEDLVKRYLQNHQLNILTLRPRAFIPHWNSEVYQTYAEWAQWYWKGAVHINDFAQAVLLSIDYVSTHTLTTPVALAIDGAYDYTTDDLENWDATGAGTTFKKYYSEYYDLAIQHGLDPNQKPTVQSISEANKILGYQPRFGFKNLLEELSLKQTSNLKLI
jgi:nucleoside-diphosphate-sugar epimerase